MAVAGDVPRARVAMLAEVLDVDLSTEDPAARAAGQSLPLARNHEPFVEAAVVDRGDAIHRQPRPVPSGGWPTRPTSPGTPGRWEFIEEAARVELRAALKRERTKRTPRRCASGVCGSCGVIRSVRWIGKYAITPSVGALNGRGKWTLCGDCHALASRWGDPSHDAFHRAAVRAVFGMRDTASVPLAIKLYGELWDGEPQDAPGCEERWSYITQEDREAVWARHPYLAPPDVQARRDRIERAKRLVQQARKPQPSAVLLDEPERSAAQ